MTLPRALELPAGVCCQSALDWGPLIGVGPSGRTGSGYWIDRLPGVLLLKLYGADIAESGVEPSGIVDAVDELGKIFDDVGECRTPLDRRLLMKLSAFVVVRISSPAHGPSMP
jgi:hypothetical protein